MSGPLLRSALSSEEGDNDDVRGTASMFALLSECRAHDLRTLDGMGVVLLEAAT